MTLYKELWTLQLDFISPHCKPVHKSDKYQFACHSTHVASPRLKSSALADSASSLTACHKYQLINKQWRNKPWLPLLGKAPTSWEANDIMHPAVLFREGITAHCWLTLLGSSILAGKQLEISLRGRGKIFAQSLISRFSTSRGMVSMTGHW